MHHIVLLVARGFLLLHASVETPFPHSVFVETRSWHCGAGLFPSGETLDPVTTHYGELIMKNALIASLLMLAGSMAYAQSQNNGDGGGGQFHGNPAIAAACDGKPVGTKVSVTLRDGQPHEIECGMHHRPQPQDGGNSGAANPAQ
jgi:hypothetical protein